MFPHDNQWQRRASAALSIAATLDHPARGIMVEVAACYDRLARLDRDDGRPLQPVGPSAQVGNVAV